ncbi:Teichoic acid translocation permease protein TagG [Sporomusa carbonis]|uniref:ABC transporter permease n=1 Tax=Sporomusa carbonis TaxID=3076075 RepID=UPI003A5E1DA4
MQSLFNLFHDLWKSKYLILNLARNDFKTRYAGSYLGIFWAFVQPVMTILVLWFVFEIGFRTAKVQDVPFILWLSCGLIPWFYFADAWSNATNSFVEYSYLVKKVVFKISSLPFIKIISSLFIHLFFVVFLLVLFISYGYSPGLIAIQLLYFIFCTFTLVVSLSLLTASIIPFFKDLAQILNIVLQFGMWMTPIMWNYTMVPEKYRWLFSLNPMFYIVQGYRDTLINKVYILQNVENTLYFWGITSVFFLVGTWTFKKLNSHFADVL